MGRCWLIGSRQHLTTNVLTNGAINPSPPSPWLIFFFFFASFLLFDHVQIVTGHTGEPPERNEIEFEKGNLCEKERNRI